MPTPVQTSMTHGQRVLNAVDPETTVAHFTDVELAELLSELSDRPWWNEFWDHIYGLAVAEVMWRHIEQFHPEPRANSQPESFDDAAA